MLPRGLAAEPDGELVSLRRWAYSNRAVLAYVWLVVWPAALIAWLYAKTAHLGFNVLDEGLVESYGKRILDGQVPHRDFISPRPVGSSLLHLWDFLVPLPLYLAGRLIGIATVVGYSLLLAWLVYARPPRRWGLAAAAGVAAAATVNLNTFVETPWYTFDGLLLSAAALLVLGRALAARNAWLIGAAFLLAGVAVTTKQSFAPLPLVMLAWVAWATPGPLTGARGRTLVGAALIAALPMALYMAVIAALGGGAEAVSQLTSGRVVWGRGLFEFVGVIGGPGYGRPAFSGPFPWEVALVAVAVALARRRDAPAAVRALLALVMTVVVTWLCLRQHLEIAGSWSLGVMWALIVVVLVRVAFERRVPWRDLAVLLLAWMAMLSRGSDLPQLVAGSMALAIVAWSLEGVRLPALGDVGHALTAAAAAAVVLVLVGAQEVDARRANPYFDRPAPELTRSVASFSPDFRGIKTSPAVFDYLRGLRDCRERYPAHWTVVLPDNPGLYMTLKLHNPLPLDWFFKQDFEGQSDQVVEAARRLNATGNYLVLFQTVSGFVLSQYDRLPPATRTSQAVMLGTSPLYDEQTGRELVRTLRGRHVVCGSFLGIWSPKRLA